MIFLPFIFSLLFGNGGTTYNPYLLEGRAQGTTYRILYYATDSLVSKKSVDALLDQIDSSLSLYKSYSLINRFNADSQGVQMDAHFEAVLRASLETWKDTDGLFDITVKPLVEAWGFGVKKSYIVPHPDTVIKLLACTGSDKLTISDHYASKSYPCLQVDMNGIAQGYSVDQLALMLEHYGVENYLVELGGEIRVKGRKKPGNEPFQVGIESPEVDEWDQNLLQKTIPLVSGAITTSGSYRNYYESDGQIISHIIDPRIGLPIPNVTISVTVWAKDAMTADAYDNALLLMGWDNGLKYLEGKNDIGAYFIYKLPDGSVKDTASIHFPGKTIKN